MEKIRIHCISCGHIMFIDPKVISFRCSECGQKIDLDSSQFKNMDRPEHTNMYEYKLLALFIIVPLLLLALIGLLGSIGDIAHTMRENAYIDQGYISPGKSARDYIGENQKSVIAQLKSVGFTNIEKTAIGAGLALWDMGKVTDIMIDGNNHFGAHAYFHPDSKIHVTYK